jgi:putative GTP pyrophosphokinase
MSKAITVKDDFISRIPIFEKLARNLSSAIELLLEENGIDYLKVYHRIKDVDSFLEKITRKKYDTPFDQVEDICGIRIICYYPQEVAAIRQLLNKELDVSESFDKESSLGLNQFGYRSSHLIASIPSTWFNVPNFRNLKGLKAEIQIRTVLMHAWAEIEHKLSYKKASHIPDDFKRKLFRISAKLEESDDQFQELKEQSARFQEKIIEDAKAQRLDFSSLHTVDLDTFQAYLDFRFPRREKNLTESRELLDQLQEMGIQISDIEEGYTKLEPYVGELEKPILEIVPTGYSQTGAVRNVLDYTSEKFYQKRDGSFKEEIQTKKKKFQIPF